MAALVLAHRRNFAVASKAMSVSAWTEIWHWDTPQSFNDFIVLFLLLCRNVGVLPPVVTRTFSVVSPIVRFLRPSAPRSDIINGALDGVL